MDLNLLVGSLFGAGGSAFFAAAYQVVRSWRSDKATSEAGLIDRLDTRLRDAERQRDQAAAERDTAREQAMRYRLLALEKGATRDELNQAGAVDGP